MCACMFVCNHTILYQRDITCHNHRDRQISLFLSNHYISYLFVYAFLLRFLLNFLPWYLRSSPPGSLTSLFDIKLVVKKWALLVSYLCLILFAPRTCLVMCDKLSGFIWNETWKSCPLDMMVENMGGLLKLILVYIGDSSMSNCNCNYKCLRNTIAWRGGISCVLTR